jgi:hypothetical protein
MSNEPPFPGEDLVWFYNNRGTPLFYLLDGEHFYHVDGTPIGYLYDNLYVISYSGDYLGWIHNGWIIDYSDGGHAFYTEFSSGGPVKPVRQVRPVRSVRAIRPVKSVRSVRPVKPVRSLSWSNQSFDAFFPDY